ncbi:MAG: hypothetical protein ACJ8DU_14980 [Microvirga sp.]|nr:hypothetical protein [Beijerinckiaceae bacterium]
MPADLLKDDRPDHWLALAEVLARKAEGRRNLAKKSFGEKIAAMEELRERLAPIRRAREKTRLAAQASARSGKDS